MNNKNIFYLHIPKTAGTSMNSFLTSQYDNNEYLTHIESKIDFNTTKRSHIIDSYKLLSGHINLPQMQQHYKVLEDRITIATFRIPIEHIISHISWVKKLGDRGEEQRLKQHSKIIQKIVQKLVNTDLSQPIEITNFINWLEKEKIFLFHNTQTRYLSGGPHNITPRQITIALENIKKINFVGISERLLEFKSLLCYKLNWRLLQEDIIKNKNSNNYGLDINNKFIRQALEPLFQWDNLIYTVAKEKFIDDIHHFLKDFEKSMSPKFSSLNAILIAKQFKGNK